MPVFDDYSDNIFIICCFGKRGVTVRAFALERLVVQSGRTHVLEHFVVQSGEGSALYFGTTIHIALVVVVVASL